MYIGEKKVLSAQNGTTVSFKCDIVKKDSNVLKTTDNYQIKTINEKINSHMRKVPINCIIKLKKDSPVYLEISDEKNKVSSTLGKVEQAITNPTTKDTIIKHISRIGDTIFSIDNITVEIEKNIFVPVSILNNLRRKVLNQLIEKRLYKTEYVKGEYTINVPDFERTKKYSVLDGNGKYDYIYTSDYNKVKENVFYKVPRVNYNYLDIKSRVLVGEVGSLYKYNCFDTDFSFNIVNSYGVALMHSIGALKVTLSYELNLQEVKDIINAYHKRYNKHPNLEVIVSSTPEVMVSKFNLLEYYGVKNGKLKDKFGNQYPIKISNGLMYIYYYKKIELPSRDYFDIGVNVVRNNL